jgi:hypothetical protein
LSKGKNVTTWNNSSKNRHLTLQLAGFFEAVSGMVGPQMSAYHSFDENIRMWTFAGRFGMQVAFLKA